MGTRPALAADVSHASAPRTARFAATIDDVARLAIGSIVALIAAVVWLFWRTSWGAVDATGFDTAIAGAILLAPAPTWTAWMLAGALDDGATPGQSRRGIGVHFRRTPWRGARLVRFALHPLSAPGWLWLAAIAYLMTFAPLDLLLLLMAAAVALGGLGSAILVAIGRRPLHDLAVGSEVVEIEVNE